MISNKSKKNVIASDCKICKHIFSQAIGLMFRPKPKALIMVLNREKRISLHMFFVFFPIDVLGLNAMKKVIALREHLKPFRFFSFSLPCQYILELPAGTIKKSKTDVGDVLNFKV